MDSQGYPEEKELRLIRKWDVSKFMTLIQFVEERWTYHDFIKRRIIKDTIGSVLIEWTLITGGWSGNESLVNALLSNQMFEFWYYEWTRGGRHIFRIDPRNVGYKLVSKYCEEKRVSRQYVAKLIKENKIDFIKLTPNKVFVK